MPNIFLSRPDNLVVNTLVERLRLLDDGRPALVLAENPFRPAGGGQPADRGVILGPKGEIRVADVTKADGHTWVIAQHGTFTKGQRVEARVDAARRLLLSQGHSLTHLLMAAIREIVSGYESKGADISESGREIELRFRASEPVTRDMQWAIDRLTRSRIAQALPISIGRARSLDTAPLLFEHWRIDPDLNLGGKIRVVSIDGIDDNPCAGTHVASTADIGPYAIEEIEKRPAGLYLLKVRKLSAWAYWF